MAAVYNANNQDVLFNLISNYAGVDNRGNNIVNNGDLVVAAEETFSGAPYAWVHSLYYTENIYFSLVCSGAMHSCVLDGSNNRRIMAISGTGSGTMRLSGIHFKDGYPGNYNGGALYIYSSALVSLVACKFSSNHAGSYGGAIYAKESGTAINLYLSYFDENSASSGDDISAEKSASVTVHSTCPQDWSGTPESGSDLDTFASSSSTLSGTTKSFGIG